MAPRREFNDGGGTEPEAAPDILLHFTLFTYFEETLERDQCYRPPPGLPFYCAKNREQLQWAVENLDPTSYPEPHRSSDGLILFISPEKWSPLLQPGPVDDAPPTLLQVIPPQAIVDKRRIPRRDVKFPLPIDLELEMQPARNRLQRMATALTSGFYIYLVAFIASVLLALFPATFPGEGATTWITYFLNNGGAIPIVVIVALFAAGGIYLLLPLSRLQFGIERGSGVVAEIQNVFRFIRPLDPGPRLCSSRGLAMMGLLFLLSSVGALWLWYSMVEVATVEFQIKQLGRNARTVTSDTIVDAPVNSTLELNVVLPPHLAGAHCSWSTSEITSIIREGQGNCQAVYDSRSTLGDDRITVSIVRRGARAVRGGFTVRIGSG